MHPELILLLGPFWIHDWADDIFCLVCVFQGTAGSLHQPDGEARFPRQMARHRRESDDVFKVRPPRHLARRTGLPVSARQTFRVRISLVLWLRNSVWSFATSTVCKVFAFILAAFSSCRICAYSVTATDSLRYTDHLPKLVAVTTATAL